MDNAYNLSVHALTVSAIRHLLVAESRVFSRKTGVLMGLGYIFLAALSFPRV